MPGTATEKNNEGFEVQRSTDAKEWKTLDFVLGNGTTLETQNYTYLDVGTDVLGRDVLVKRLYYRLQQIDLDGQFEYSDIINVELGISDYELQIFPNPVQDQLNIIDGQGQATIYNVLGQPVKELTIHNGQSRGFGTSFTINVSDLPKGQYILHIQQENGHINVKQFIK